MGYARIVAFMLLASVYGCDQPVATALPPAPVEVVAVALEETAVPVTSDFVAQVRSSHQVDIMARTSGFLEQIAYREGELVEAGQVMFRLDPKPFQAQVDAVRAEVAIRQAQLETVEANLERILPLAALDAASQSDLDNATGQVKAAAAALTEARARLQKADLELGYATIKAPLSGIAGQSLLREGAYIAANGPAAESLDPSLFPPPIKTLHQVIVLIANSPHLCFWHDEAQFAGQLHAEGFIFHRVRQGDGSTNRGLENMAGRQGPSRFEDTVALDIDRNLVLGTGQGEADTCLTGQQRQGRVGGHQGKELVFRKRLVTADFR